MRKAIKEFFMFVFFIFVFSIPAFMAPYEKEKEIKEMNTKQKYEITIEE